SALRSAAALQMVLSYARNSRRRSVRRMRSLVLICFVLVFSCAAFAQPQTQPQRNYPAPVEGDYVIKDFHFRSGETLPELKMHYRTIGTLKKNSAGVATNAVLAGHGTGGNGGSLLNPTFA